MTDFTLVEGLKQRSPEAFEQLVRQHGATVWRVAARIVGRQEAEEVVQDALLTVFEKVHTFDHRAALSTWLYRVVVNTALMRLRARSRWREEASELEGPEFTAEGRRARAVSDWAMSPEDTTLRAEACRILRQGIERLPGSYRAVYVLAEVEGLPHQEVAALLDLTVGAVKTRLHRARLSLREALDAHFAEQRPGHGPRGKS